MTDKKIKVLCIAGPTASGKTALSVELARCFNGEIISADSMQLYKGIHIASAAPDNEEMQGIPHHLIEILPITAACSVADYTEMAHCKIAEISARGKLPVVVGGTGLYINSLIDGINFVEQETDYELRERLTRELEMVGAEEMLNRLAQIDPETAAKLHPNDRRRIIRAFEIYETSGKTKSQADKDSKTGDNCPYDVLMIGLNAKDRNVLYERIGLRVDIMLKNGLLEEAATTFDNAEGGAVQAIGHKELHPYLRGETSLEEAVDNLKRATRRYAKRQLTWFRRDERINWVFIDSPDPIEIAKKLTEEWRKPDEG